MRCAEPLKGAGLYDLSSSPEYFLTGEMAVSSEALAKSHQFSGLFRLPIRYRPKVKLSIIKARLHAGAGVGFGQIGFWFALPLGLTLLGLAGPGLLLRWEKPTRGHADAVASPAH